MEPKRLFLFAALIIVVVVILTMVESHFNNGKEQSVLEACGTMCDGEVESFKLDWTHDPVCICK